VWHETAFVLRIALSNTGNWTTVTPRTEKKPSPEDIESMSFEQAIAALETIVKRLESGQISLEESIDDYTRGTALRSHCAKKISDARLQVEKIIRQSDGTIATENFITEE